MQVVIDLPDEIYNYIHNEYMTVRCRDAHKIAEAIFYGTPLPKGHGDLIDRDALEYEDIECTDGRTYMAVNAYDVDNAPTIIEADKGE